ncbi:hypothetical protein ACF1CG_13485 [Streptomyces sp. NPDC014773]|uniref:hypothetical protein n=1 Tax=Streptomyces sp. NPDC014773 TaxID=3364908 RepID=UPI0036F77296
MRRTALPRTALARTVVATGAALAVLMAAFTAQGAERRERNPGGATAAALGISGIAVTQRTGSGFEALVVHDSKKPGEPRISQYAYRPGKAPRVVPLDWRGAGEPVDLEAIDRVPGRPGEYIALAGEGIGYRVRVVGDAGDAGVEVLDLFPLPAIAEGDNFESFALAPTAQPGVMVAVWADRGQDDRPATLYAARMVLDQYGEPRFGAVRTAEIRAPYPSDDVRHASDLKITASGGLLVSSASDPGDDGPFDSAVYAAGHVGLDASGAVRLATAEAPRTLAEFEGHKVEALDCVPGTRRAALGTDDEANGGSLLTAAICGR